jgi:hypothetical protein
LATLKCAKNIRIVGFYNFYLKRTRSLITKYIYSKKNNLKRLNNTPVMFLRSPKHFKRGKQHIFFFRGGFKQTYNFNCNTFIIYNLKKNVINSLMSSFINKNLFTDFLLSKIIIKQTIFLKINWSGLFLLN